MKLSTRAIHVGNDHKDPAHGALVPPLYFSALYSKEDENGDWGTFDYSRTGNPTRAAFEETIANLEGASGALAFSSGMAAIHCATMLLAPGDHIVCGADVYGGTYRLLHKIVKPLGIDITMVPTGNLEAVAAAFTAKTRLVWIESPGNPLLSITDIAAIARITYERGALLAVDNTFATPVFTRPIELGADLVMHSATKFIGGHSDLLGGVLAVKDPELLKKLAFLQNATGAVMAPMDAFLASRGIKTLSLRVKEQSQTALKVAAFLVGHPKVMKVYYPGLSNHPGHQLAKKQMSGNFGSVMSFEIVGGYDEAKQFSRSTSLFRFAVSFGAVESLIEQPASMSHASYAQKDRLAHGIRDNLVRLSIGLEDGDDLIADLQQAFARLQPKSRVRSQPVLVEPSAVA